MFELRTWCDEHHGELVQEACAAMNASKSCFQVFVSSDRRRSPERDADGEVEAARLVDLLEAEGWMLENVAHVREREHDWAYGLFTGTVVGTIYTFQPSTSPQR